MPTTGGNYDAVPVQYPFPSAGGDTGPTSNMTVTVAGKDVSAEAEKNPFKNPDAQQADQSQSQDTKAMRKGGKVKPSVRGDGIAQRGKTKGRFV